MVRECLVHISLDDTSFSSSKLSDHKHFEKMFAVSATWCLVKQIERKKSLSQENHNNEPHQLAKKKYLPVYQ